MNNENKIKDFVLFAEEEKYLISALDTKDGHILSAYDVRDRFGNKHKIEVNLDNYDVIFYKNEKEVYKSNLEDADSFNELIDYVDYILDFFGR